MGKFWDKFAEDYGKRVLSLTEVPQRRKQILAEIKKGKILNLGTGPTPYLNRDLIKKGNAVVATDFSDKMLKVAAKLFTHPKLKYRLADNRNIPFRPETFDSVISVNSILPGERKDASIMVKEVHRVLKTGGKFVAILPSFETALEGSKVYKTRPKIDKKQLRVWDTNQWQCFQTRKTINQMINKVGFRNYKIRKAFYETKEDIRQFKRVYGIDISKYFPKYVPYSHFLIATK